MSGFDLFKLWLRDVAGITEYQPQEGAWHSYDDSNLRRYIAFSVVGGRAPRELDTQFMTINVTIVSAKAEGSVAVREMAENILEHAKAAPEVCGLVAVNPLGPTLGPAVTEANRRAVNLSLEVIT